MYNGAVLDDIGTRIMLTMILLKTSLCRHWSDGECRGNSPCMNKPLRLVNDYHSMIMTHPGFISHYKWCLLGAYRWAYLWTLKQVFSTVIGEQNCWTKGEL